MIIGTQRVFKAGETITYRNKIKDAPLVGVPYVYKNQPIAGGATGTIYNNSPDPVLHISSLDNNGTNHYDNIQHLQIGDSITVGTQTGTLVLRPTYIGGGMWSFDLTSWPFLADGTYTVSVTQ